MEQNCLNKGVTLMFVHASWCGNCKALEPIVKEVVLETGVNFKDVDAEKEMDLCEKEGIMNLPVTILTSGEKKVRIDGVVTKQKLLDTINSFK